MIAKISRRNNSKAFYLLRLTAQLKATFVIVNMEWNKLMVLFAVFLMGQMTRAAVDPASSIDKGSLISNLFLNSLKGEILDPIKPVAIPIQSALDSQQRKKRAGDTSTSKSCASVFDDARNGFNKIVNEAIPDFVNQYLPAGALKSDDDLNSDCYNSKGESILAEGNDVVIEHQWAVEKFKLP
ncbi:hypothetical protein DAPPUDRAFT_259596 [Daphnia pulex]|uniref:Uncharacterized protein n=1 Tax=Daphnia pulex TaxID=6669 RepID=E9HHH1_DAPPU|nr:hypothetical protein DAPPUDRAFT_259596 [Daphnia pulex]|eukprot:EFX68777.1 hypothetical protein DAPPUDRAFT_259596 [Daphnia pulex]